MLTSYSRFPYHIIPYNGVKQSKRERTVIDSMPYIEATFEIQAMKSPKRQKKKFNDTKIETE